LRETRLIDARRVRLKIATRGFLHVARFDGVRLRVAFAMLSHRDPPKARAPLAAAPKVPRSRVMVTSGASRLRHDYQSREQTMIKVSFHGSRRDEIDIGERHIGSLAEMQFAG
jgi:hypothetical protein